VACRGSIIKAAKQKERFEHSRKELVQKIHRFPVCSVSPKRAEATVKTPPRLPSKPEKRPRPSPLARTGVSPLTKRPPLAEAVQRDGKQPVDAHNIRGRNQLLVVNCSLYQLLSRLHPNPFKSDPFLPLKKKPKPYKKFCKWLFKRRKAASIQH